MIDAGFRAWFSGIRPQLVIARDQLAAELAALGVDEPLVAGLWAKAARGWEEHGGNIVRMTDRQLALEERGELLDLLAYRATRLRG